MVTESPMLTRFRELYVIVMVEPVPDTAVMVALGEPLKLRPVVIENPVI